MTGRPEASPPAGAARPRRPRGVGPCAALALATLALGAGSGCNPDKTPPVTEPVDEGPLLEDVGEGEPPDPVRPPVDGDEVDDDAPEAAAGDADADARPARGTEDAPSSPAGAGDAP